MTLTPCADRAAAAWITRADLPWQQLVCFGPSGFPAYVRLRFIPDPQHVGQSETSAVVGGGGTDAEQLQVVLTILRSQSRTPDDLYFGFWDGAWGGDFSGTKVEVPNRSYFLFRGTVSERGEWSASVSGNHAPAAEPLPAFIWPSDHAWCLANDVDPHWAGIGGRVEAIHQLMADPRLDVVLADPTRKQPIYE